MRLIIHAGLHKTASTYFQHVLMLNLAALQRNGVYAQPDAKLTAHHGSAWMALRDDFRHVQAHLRQAQRLNLSTVLLSSEDFEGLIFAPVRAAALEQAAMAAGAEAVEWHFCLRDPGEYLLSMYAELTKHVLVDFGAMFLGALRDGRYSQTREAARLPVAWELCFDHETFLRAFATGIAGEVVLHDYRDRLPFPMHRLYERLTAADAPALPGERSRNARQDGAGIAQQLAARFEEIVGVSGLDEATRTALEAGLVTSDAVRETCAAALSRKFAPGMERLLAAGTT